MTSPPRRSRFRSFCSALLIVAGVIVLPAAQTAAWAQDTLIDQAGFVQTFTPLADDERVHALIVDQAGAAITASTDLGQIDASIQDRLDNPALPQAARDALKAQLSQAMLAAQQHLEDELTALTESDDFGAVWNEVLTTSHDQATRQLAGEDVPAGERTDNGALGVQTAPVAAALQERVAAENPQLAALIPTEEHTIAVTPANSVDRVRLAYRAVQALVPWGVVAALVAAALGIGIARHRGRALVVWAIVSLILTGGLALGVGVSGAFATGASRTGVGTIVLDTLAGSLQARLIPLLIGMAIVLVVGAVATTAARKRAT